MKPRPWLSVLRNRVLPWALLLGVVAPVAAAPARSPAAQPFGFALPEGAYDPAIPTPDQVLGFALGTRPLTPEEIFRYARALAQASPRLRLERYGTSAEGRPLVFLYASTPEHLQQLEELKARWLRLAFPGPTSDPLPASQLDTLPVQVWLLYGIHGNEHSSAEAALTLAYYLAAARDPRVRRVLDQVVAVLDPMQNPDGRARFVQHFRQNVGPTPDAWRWALEHREPWPSGRYNHYLFDLNRDCLFQTQAETRARLTRYFQGPPQVVVDFHEMGEDATYYFAPPSEPVLQWLPGYVRRFWETFGRANARAFEQRGWPYFFREVFDIFYPGYGDSFPTLHGAIGMTYEQASARGVVLRRKDGTLLRLVDAIEHHFTSGWTTLQTAAAHRRELLRAYLRMRRNATGTAARDPWGWWIPGTNDRWLRAHLAAVLTRLRIRILAPRQDLRLATRDPYRGEKAATRTARPGDWILPAHQASGLVLKVWMAPDVPLDEAFLRRARERRAAGESPGFYDITAWSLPRAWGLRVYEITRPVPLDRLQPATAAATPRAGAVPTASYAYLVCNDSLALYRMVGEALRHAFPFRVSRRPITIRRTHCPAGSLVFFVRRQPDVFRDWIRGWQQRGTPTILALDSGWVESGVSLGSGAVTPVDRTRRTVLLTGPGTWPSEVGAIWYTLEQVYHWPLSRVPLQDLDHIDLQDVRVLVVPPLSPGRAPAARPKDAPDPVRSWLHQGGTLILIGSAIRWAARRGLLDLARDTNEKPAAPAEATLPPASVPGALLRIQRVHHHWLLAGARDPVVAVLFRGRDVPQPEPDGVRVALRFADAADLVAAGFVWPDMKKRIAGRAFAWVQRQGAGQVIAMVQQPMFRGDFWATHRVLLNALLFGSRIP